MHIQFAGRKILVVGAARGIGHAIARSFAERNGEVVAADILFEEMRDLAMPYEGSGRVELRAIDVADADSVRATVGGESFDILVYVAGGVRGQRPLPIEQVTPASFREIVEANLTGCFVVAQAVAPAMKRAGHGRIVTISSRAGLATSLTGIQAYASAKHAQIGLVKQLAQELGPFGITVNSVAPGFMATSPDYQRQWDGYSEEFRRTFAEQRIAMRRMGTPEDIAYAVLFLASDYASWITGQVLPVLGSPVA
jgi:3-oxoacyl-[acyl-carrier protein] reductase